MNWKNKFKAAFNQDGFMMIQLVLTLLIACFLIPMVVTCLKILAEQIEVVPNIQDEIGVNQLRRILNVSYDKQISNDEMMFTYQNKNRSLVLLNEKLVMKPGTNVFLTEIETICFDVYNDCVYLTYERDQETKTSILTHLHQ